MDEESKREREETDIEPIEREQEAQNAWKKFYFGNFT